MVVAFAALLPLAMAGCSKGSGRDFGAQRPPGDTIITPPPVVSKTYLALGDSYTIGQGVSIDDRFPHQTATLLRGRGIAMAVPQYIATTGWTTANLLDGIANQKPQPGYDVVSLLIGVNNQYQRRDTAEYRVQFTQCLQKAIELTGNRRNRVFVLSIPDYGVTPFGLRLDTARIAREINIFNAINKRVTESSGVSWIEITQGSRDALIDTSLVAQDGLHPSGKEYYKWAAKLYAEMIKVLN